MVRFPDRTSHQIFLEPEGIDDDTVYPNGVSTSVSEATQDAFLRTIPGLERVSVRRYGYAIEYDYVDPRELTPALEVRAPAGALPRRPDQRHHRLRGGRRRRGWSPGSTPRAPPPARRRPASAATRPISA